MRHRVLSVTCALAVVLPFGASLAGDAAVLVGPRVVHMPAAAPSIEKPPFAAAETPAPAFDIKNPPYDPQKSAVATRQDPAPPVLAPKPQQGEVKPQQAEAKPQQAEAKPQQAEAKPQQAEAKPQQAEAKPQQAEAKPQQAEAKPQQAEAKPQQAEAKPQQAAIAAPAGPDHERPAKGGRGDAPAASETAAASHHVAPPASGAASFAMPTRRNPSKTAEKRPVDPVKPAVAVVTPPPDANADPNARAPVDLQAVLSGDVEASEPPPPPVPQPRFGADAFAMPAPRVREIAPQKSAKKRAEITPQRFQSRCQASWGKLAGEGPFGVCVLN